MIDKNFYRHIIVPGLEDTRRVCDVPNAAPVGGLMLAIAIQESALLHRYQVLRDGKPGPARGWWQFERGGGVVGVMTHESTKTKASAICEFYEIAWRVDDIWRALEGHDGLCVAFARLLLWSDPAPLPTTSGDSWGYYLRNWRPGKPDKERWIDSWSRAMRAIW